MCTDCHNEEGKIGVEPEARSQPSAPSGRQDRGGAPLTIPSRYSGGDQRSPPVPTLPIAVCVACAGLRMYFRRLFRHSGSAFKVLAELRRLNARIRLPDGQELAVRPFSNDPAIVKEIYFMRSYERFFLPREGDVVADVGAHIGVFANRVAKMIGPNGMLLSFEPEAENFGFLQANIRMNRHSNVIAFRKAMSSSKGTRPFRVSGTGASGGHTLEIAPASPSSHPFRSVLTEVECDTLDSALRERGIKRLDFLKIDVEGHELEVLKGAEDSIRRFRPKVVVERKPVGQSPDHVRNWLVSHGYTVMSARDLPSLVYGDPAAPGSAEVG